MIDLICSKCQTKLPVAESKIGTRIFVCPKCAYPLEAPGTPSTPSAPARVEEPKPQVSAQSEDKTMAPDESLAYVQEKLREAAARRAAKASQPAEPQPAQPQPAEPPQKKRAAKAGRSAGLLWGGIAAAVLAVVGIGALAFLLTRGAKPAPQIAKKNDAIQGDSAKEPARPRTEDDSLDALTKALQDGPGPARKKALQELKKRGPDARPALAAVLEILKDPDADLRTLAQETLVRMGRAGKSDVPIFAAALRDPTPELRVYAAGRLAELGRDAKGELVFLRVLSLDDNPQVQEAARKAVERIEEATLADSVKGLQDKSAAVRSHSARELAAMGAGAKAALPSLVEALADGNSAVRLAVLDVFVAIGPDAIMVLGEALRDKNPNVRSTAINALGRMGSDARFVLPDLINVALADDVTTQEESLQALARIGEFAIPFLVQALERDKNPARQKRLVEALERLGPSAGPALKAALEKAKPEAGKAAAQVIAKASSQPSPPPRKDHTGTAGVWQSQMRGWFNATDSDNDGFLDKDELARAIRGPKAKAYDDTPPGKATKQFGPQDFNKYPDYAFLCRLDRDNDGKISRDEFEQWAYDYAEYLKKDKEDRDRITQAQLRMAQKAQSAALRVQQEAALAQLWASYNDRRATQNAMYRDINQLQWLQRWTLNRLPQK